MQPVKPKRFIPLSSIQMPGTGRATRPLPPRKFRKVQGDSFFPAPLVRLPPGSGKMDVNLVVNGGEPAFLSVLEGLVQRNEKLFRDGIVRPSYFDNVVEVHDGVWRDALAMAMDQTASVGALAACKAAELRVKGTPAQLAVVGGIPKVLYGGPSQQLLDIGSGSIPTLNDTGGGRISEWMRVIVTPTDVSAINLVGNAMAQHNRRLMESGKIPRLYDSGIRYAVEGSPEVWMDAQEALRRGADDCEGLAAYRAGELLRDGYDAEVAVREIPTQAVGDMGGTKGGKLYHAITKVTLPGGKVVYDDPSKRLGMPVPKWYNEYARRLRAEGKPL